MPTIDFPGVHAICSSDPTTPPPNLRLTRRLRLGSLFNLDLVAKSSTC
jgi:hypothetical protein